jgi:hypothetical protein
MPGICVNEDNAHFYANHPPEDMTAQGVRALVDYYADFPGVSALFFCANVQRALFASRVWERLYDGYDPDAGPDQPVLRWLQDPRDRELTLGSQGRYWLHNLWLLEQRGVDHPAVWLERCRERGLEGWLTVRMNDCHYNDIPAAFWHSSFWREHPEYYRAPYREEHGWERALDYAQPAVRQHHLALIRELLDRYDLYGLELDWMRWGLHFRPGQEAAGRKILTDFTAQVRALARRAAQRLGHPVRVGARVPAKPGEAWALGYDVGTWVEQHLVDHVVISSFCSGLYGDYPVDEWCVLLGHWRGSLAVCLDSGLTPFPGARGVPIPVEAHCGAAAAAYQRGADRVYLFNVCYYESEDRPYLGELLTRLADLGAICGGRRRQVITYSQTAPPGTAPDAVLPLPLISPHQGATFARMNAFATLRFALGARPVAGKAWLRLGLSADTPRLTARRFQVWCNGVRCAPASKAPRAGATHPAVARLLTWEVPLEALQDDVNVVELQPPQVAGTIVWAEIGLDPRG